MLLPQLPRQHIYLARITVDSLCVKECAVCCLTVCTGHCPSTVKKLVQASAEPGSVCLRRKREADCVIAFSGSRCTVVWNLHLCLRLLFFFLFVSLCDESFCGLACACVRMHQCVISMNDCMYVCVCVSEPCGSQTCKRETSKQVVPVNNGCIYILQ